MNNFTMATDATNTALNSQGSAMREQAKYADSLEARVNRLDTAWNRLTLSAGDAFLTDGLIATVETLNDIATATSGMIDKFGLLSGVFGTLGVAVTLLSTRFRIFTTSLIFGTAEMSRSALATAGLTAGMSRLGIATIGATAALRGLLASTLVGAAFVAIGFAIEKVISAYSDAKQAQEEFEASQQKNIEALTTNKERTNELIDSYKKLSSERKNGDWNIEKEKEYLQIQQQLGEIFPSLISSVDANGQYHLLSSDAIKKEIEATNELIELKKEEIRLNALKNFEENVGNRDGFFGLEKDVERKRAQIQELIDVGAERTLINEAKVELLRLEGELANASMMVTEEVLKVSEAYNKLNIDPTIRQNIDSFISSLDFSKLNPSELEAYSIKLAQLTDEMQKAYDAGDIQGFNSARESLKDYAGQFGATELQARGLNVTLDKVKQKNEEVANATYNGRDGTEGMADAQYELGDASGYATDAVNGQTGAIDGNTDAKFDNITASEILFGVTSDQIKQAEQAIMIVSMLSQAENLSAQQKALLADATGFLAGMYPHLNGQISENLGWISQQIGMMGSLNQASGSNAAVMMANQDSITKASVAAVNQRIRAYQTEIAALQKTYNAAIQMANDFEQATGEVAPFKAGIISVRNRLSSAQLGLATAQSTKLDAVYGSGIKTGQIKPYEGDSRYPSSKGKGSGGSKDKKAKEKDPIEQYYTPEAEKKLRDLNKSLEESEAKTNRLITTSKAYRDELNKQYKLNSQGADVVKGEINRLNSRNTAIQKALKNYGSFSKLTTDKAKEHWNELSKELESNQEKIAGLNKDYLSFKATMEDINWEIYTSSIEEQRKQVDKLKDSISDSQKRMSLYEGDTDKQKKEALLQIKLNKEMIKALENEKKVVDGAIKSGKLNAKQKEEMIQKLEELNNEIIDYQVNVKEANNQLLDIYKEYYDKKREMDKKALDDELAAYEKATQRKLDLIEKEEAARDRGKELAERQQQIAELQAQINAMSGDSSKVGMVADLQEELLKMQEELNEYLHDNAVEDRKNALQDGLEERRENAELQKEQIDIYYDTLYSTQEAMFKLNDTIDQKLLKSLDNLAEVLKGKVNDSSGSGSNSSPVKFDTGGWTGNGEGLAWLDKKEIILKDTDSENFLKAINLTRHITNLIPKITLPKMSQGLQSSPSVTMNVNIASLTGDRQGVNKFFDEVNSRLRGMGGLQF